MKKLDIKNTHSKGFTLIELIIVTVILGILATVAAPRMLGTIGSAETAAEKAVVAALRSAVEDYALEKFMIEGRYEYPPDPFTLVEVTGYVGTGSNVNGLNDGDWWAVPETFGNGPQGLLIKHRRNNDSVYGWSYFPGDHTDRPSDDRGINIGGSVAHLEVFDSNGNSMGFDGPSTQINGICIENCD
tara:strand:+ start:1417 stop:1977 length:561 start_codon:yes stop_codon:yes gene_type:complete